MCAPTWARQADASVNDETARRSSSRATTDSWVVLPSEMVSRGSEDHTELSWNGSRDASVHVDHAVVDVDHKLQLLCVYAIGE